MDESIAAAPPLPRARAGDAVESRRDSTLPARRLARGLGVLAARPPAAVAVQPDRTRSTRIEIADALRGLAALAVCWFHLTSGNPQFLDEGLIKASGRYGWLGWEVFFVLSGFVVPYSLWRSHHGWRDAGSFLRRRLVRLYPPYAASLALILVLAAISAAMPGYRGEPFTVDAGRLASHLVYASELWGYPSLNPVYWTLFIEVQFYALVALVFVPLSRSRAQRVGIVVALLAISVVASDPRFVFAYLPFFALGMIAFLRRAHREPLMGTVWLAAAAGVLLALQRSPLESIVAVIAAGLLACAPEDLPIGRPLRWLGAISYSLYLVHVPVGGRVVNLGERLALPPAGDAACLALALAASLAAAWAFHRLIEAPSLRWSRRGSMR